MNCEQPNPSPSYAVVVNDDPTQLNLLAGLLRKAGLEAYAFTGAEAALAGMSELVVAGNPHLSALPALIVTDLYMPGIDGWRFCRLLRSPEYAGFNRVPILVVSATFSGEEASRIATDLGAEAFLPSPVDGPRFIEQVRAILSGERVRSLLRVLVVEDDYLLCNLFKEVFMTHGYEVETARSLKAATEAFEKTSFDVAVLDYHLPDGRGDTLLAEFRAKRSDCVCLMMTGDAEPGLALEWMKIGAAAYLRKPFEPGYLIELCAKARRERALLHVQDLLEARTRELRQSEERFAAFMSHLPAAAFVKDAEGRTLFANQYLQELLSFQHWSGKTARELVPGELGRKMAEEDRKALDHGLLETEEAITDSQGVEHVFKTIRFPIGAEGQPPLLGGIAVDITARNRTETALQNKVAELERINRLMIGRENRMLELKREINEMRRQLNLPERYAAPNNLAPETKPEKP